MQVKQEIVFAFILWNLMAESESRSVIQRTTSTENALMAVTLQYITFTTQLFQYK
jgi:hypothetical protein